MFSFCFPGALEYKKIVNVIYSQYISSVIFRSYCDIVLYMLVNYFAFNIYTTKYVFQIKFIHEFKQNKKRNIKYLNTNRMII